MSRRIFLILAIVMTFVFAAHAQMRPRKTAAAPAKPAASGLIKTASGLSYIITKRGNGRLPKVGDTVVVNYTGTLLNGKKFDSSYDSGRAITFPLGEGRVIKGWDEGIAKLHTGDQAIFIIPSRLGYGARGAGSDIPPNASLIFIVELMDINPK